MSFQVFTNTPSEGVLQRGDLIISINDRETDALTHKQCQDLIKFGGGQIDLFIKRYCFLVSITGPHLTSKHST